MTVPICVRQRGSPPPTNAEASTIAGRTRTVMTRAILGREE